MIRILVADDEPSLLETGKILLEHSGDIEVVTARNGDEAMDILRSEPLDAIISDYQMPGMDGITFLKNVRIRYPDMPFLMYTVLGQDDVVISALKNGADDYLPKGDDPGSEFNELASQVRRMVKNNALERALHESEERYRFIIENFNGIAFERKPDLTVVFAHGAIEPITGYSAEEINGKEISWDILVHQDDLPLIYDAMKEAEKDPSLSTETEYRIITKDGEVRWVQEFGHYLRKKSGRIHAVQGTLYDITERRQMTEQLIAQRDLGLGLAAARSLGEALELTLSTACKVSGMSFGALYLENPHTERFEVVRSTGFSDAFIGSISSFDKNTPICRTVAKGECIYSFFDEMKDFLGCEVSHARVRVVLVIPIVYNSSSIGFLLLGSNYPEEISDSSLMSLEVIAFQAGNAIARIWVEEMLAEGERSSGWGDEIRSKTRVD